MAKVIWKVGPNRHRSRYWRWILKLGSITCHNITVIALFFNCLSLFVVHKIQNYWFRVIFFLNLHFRYTMTKSSTIIFILFFAILFGLEKKVFYFKTNVQTKDFSLELILIAWLFPQSWLLMLTVVLISSGLCMFTYKSTQFNMLGFIYLVFASMTSGIRWTFAQIIMQKSKLGLHNPIDMIYFMQPWMILPIIPLTIYREGMNNWNVKISNLKTKMQSLCFLWKKTRK